MIKGVLIDLSGTVYEGDRLLPGAAEAIAGLHAAKTDYVKSIQCFNECHRIRKGKLGDGDAEVVAVRRFIDAIQRKMRR